MNLAAPLLVVFSYLLGSFPTAYLAGRSMKGIDIREYGSGNVGASNVSVHVSRLAFLAVGPFDFLKGMVPAWAARRLDLSLEVGVMAGLAAMVGHSWSLYLGFKGGRGISVGLGTMAMIAPLEFLLVLFILALAVLMKNVPLGIGIGMASSPLLAWLLKEPAPVMAGCGALALLTFAKRLLANWEPLRGPKREAIINRLLFDRDIRDREEWIKRLPSERR